MAKGDFKSFGGRDKKTGRFDGSQARYYGTKRTAYGWSVHDPPPGEIEKDTGIHEGSPLPDGVHSFRQLIGIQRQDEDERDRIVSEALARSKFGYLFMEDDDEDVEI